MQMLKYTCLHMLLYKRTIIYLNIVKHFIKTIAKEWIGSDASTIVFEIEKVFKAQMIEHLDICTVYHICCSLKILDLSENNMLTLPDDLFHTISRLIVINLSNNKLTQLPSNLLKEQIHLEEFDMSKNQIQIISNGSFAGLSKLKNLDLSENMIRMK